MADFCIDARMAFSSGIGTYIRQVVPLLSDLRPILLVDRVDQEWCRGLEQILFSAPIYSAKEQLLYPSKIPKCDVFWSPHYNIPLLPIRAKKRVVTIHDACHLVWGTFAERVYANIVMRHALHRSDRVLTESHFSANEIQRYLGRRHVDTIPLAVRREFFTRKVPCEGLRKKYQLPEKFVLFVGNRKPHKNIDGLMRAFSKVNIPGLGLVLAGKGHPMGQISDDELPVLYSMAEMLVFPSLYEGFGLPPLEAMSCGCPTVVSKAASIPEVCGDASVYFDPEREEEMAEAIARVAMDAELKKKLIQHGLERVKLFSWEKTAYEMRISDWSSDVCSSDLRFFTHERRTPSVMSLL